MNPTVFIIDDEADQVALVTAQLERARRFVTKGFTRAEDALDEIRADPPDAVVCDLSMPGIDGIAFTERLRALDRTLPIIIVTTRGKEGEAEQALEAGATDFVTKPIEPKALETRLRRAVEETPARELLSSVAQIKFDRHGIVGSHPLVQQVRDFVDQVASVPQVTALLLGESGTGKNMVARAIHGAGQQSAFRFMEVNCAALPASLLEAELFGYEKGAFTDARQAKKGLVEVADGGTLFLDEIGSMPLELQAKLLTFLESRVFRRIGSTTEQRVDLRVIAATNVDLAGEVRAGKFREDLYYRLNVASQVLPPLRLIKSDIPAIARQFTKRAAEYFSKPLPEIDAEGSRRLQAYDWPGNARELRNVIERAMIFSRDHVLQIPELSGGVERAGERNTIPVPRGLTLDEVERMYIEATLREVGGSINDAARQLGISRKVLWQRRKRHGITQSAA
ncbi:MAG TPA: sigma-54 dependent transcriptional regulator [Longimicrobium sp.]